MKRTFCVIICLLLTVSVLAGCSLTSQKEFTCNGLTITLPGYFLDLSQEDYAATATFLYGFNDVAVMGLQEEKSLLAEYDLELTLEEYGQLVIDGNGLDVTLDQKDGLYTFVYEAAVEETSYSYICVVLEGEDSYWCVQAYCPTEKYEKNRADMWSYLLSATVQQ